MISKDSATPDEVHAGGNGDLVIRPALDRAELESAYELVYHNYRPRDYIPANPFGLRLTIFNAFPSSVTFVGVIHDEVIATVSLIPDTPIGLPMDEIYHDEVQALRDAGRRLIEVTMLADRRLSVSRSLAMVLALMKLVFDYATLSLKATDLCITVNPHHDKFYHEYLLFTPARRLARLSERERQSGHRPAAGPGARRGGMPGAAGAAAPLLRGPDAR